MAQTVAEAPGEVTLDKLSALAKRRGFAYPSSEIYGGLNGFWDYGPLGVALRNNVKRAWWYSMVEARDDIVGLDSSIILNPQVWRVSGHVERFNDPMADCQECRRRFRADDVPEPGVCPACGGRLGEVRQFNTMFTTHVGPIADDSSLAYLRPETAQGIFINFKNVLDSSRQKIPFGIAQIGKSFRNEITTGNFVFRVREFEVMEMEFFVRPGTDDQWWQYWIEQRLQWWQDIGIRPESLSLRRHEAQELSHYSKQTTDIEFRFPFGVKELEGIADRTDYDLKAHAAGSGQDLSYFDDESGERFIPWVIEPAAGIERAFLAILQDAYVEESTGPKAKDSRIVLKLSPRVAPYKVAVFPLVSNKPDIVQRARAIYDALRPRFMTAWDDRGNVGKRYRSQDEIGTPWCITVDYQTLEDGTVTVRDRDTMQQERVHEQELPPLFMERLSQT
ncbi:MAG TPA: glycine--tRNA ligase [Chloroflexota bacterium]|nr:glycine--tRNA ligase [Chloroflexota bacterium]